MRGVFYEEEIGGRFRIRGCGPIIGGGRCADCRGGGSERGRKQLPAESSQVDAIPVSSPEEKTEGSAPEKEAVPEPEETVPTGYNGWKQWRDGSWSYCKNGAKTTGWQKVAGTWYF